MRSNTHEIYIPHAKFNHIEFIKPKKTTFKRKFV